MYVCPRSISEEGVTVSIGDLYAGAELEAAQGSGGLSSVVS